MRQKTFTFKKGVYNDLSSNPEARVTIIKCGKHKFTLKDFKEQIGHDDSLPYVAYLCVDKIPIARCFNDGWGGTTELSPITSQRALFDEMEAFVQTYHWSLGKSFKFDVKLDFIADTLACTHASMSKA